MSTKKRTGVKHIFDDHSDPATGMPEEVCEDEIATRLFSEEEEKTEDVVFDEDSAADISSDDGLVDDYFARISGNETEEEADEQKLVLQMLEKQNSPNFLRLKDIYPCWISTRESRRPRPPMASGNLYINIHFSEIA